MHPICRMALQLHLCLVMWPNPVWSLFHNTIYCVFKATSVKALMQVRICCLCNAFWALQSRAEIELFGGEG